MLNPNSKSSINNLFLFCIIYLNYTIYKMENIYEKCIEHPQIVMAVIFVLVILIIAYMYSGISFRRGAGFSGSCDPDLESEMKSLIADINKKQNSNFKDKPSK